VSTDNGKSSDDDASGSKHKLKKCNRKNSKSPCNESTNDEGTPVIVVTTTLQAPSTSQKRQNKLKHLKCCSESNQKPKLKRSLVNEFLRRQKTQNYIRKTLNHIQNEQKGVTLNLPRRISFLLKVPLLLTVPNHHNQYLTTLFKKRALKKVLKKDKR